MHFLCGFVTMIGVVDCDNGTPQSPGGSICWEPFVARRLEAPSAAGLKAVARVELRKLTAALQKAKPGQSVHGARRQIKRLRSLLRLLREAMGEEAFSAINGALRNAADAPAGLRRAEALVTAAGKLDGGRRAHSPFQQLAEAHRADHASAAAADGGTDAARRAAEALEAATAMVAGLRMKRGPAPDIGVAFLATYRKARKRLEHGFASRNAEDLHTARKHVIHHIHHLDLLRSHLTSPAKRLASLDKLREALGDLNDLDELCHLSKGSTARLPEAADRAMAKRRATLLKRAEKAAGRLFRDKPKAYGRRTVGMWVAHDR